MFDFGSKKASKSLRDKAHKLGIRTTTGTTRRVNKSSKRLRREIASKMKKRITRKRRKTKSNVFKVGCLSHNNRLSCLNDPVCDWDKGKCSWSYTKAKPYIQAFQFPDFVSSGENSCEGYWESENICQKYGSKYNSNALKTCPQSRIYQGVGDWPGKQKFMNKVKKVEKFMKGSHDNYTYTSYKGMAPSRVEEGQDVGSGEYKDVKTGMCWPSAYADHYIEKHNVLPSKRFYDYIMNFNLEKKSRVIPSSIVKPHPEVFQFPEFVSLGKKSCEGYWEYPENICLKYGSKYNSNALKTCPQSRIYKGVGEWPGKQKFINKAKNVEKFIQNVNPPGSPQYWANMRKTNYQYISFDGYAASRIEKGKDLGDSEYRDSTAGICWPSDYIDHYIEKHNVLPSKQFYDYIMNFNLKNRPKISGSTNKNSGLSQKV